MKTLGYAIVSIENEYDNEAKLSNGTTILLNTSKDVVSNITREAVIVSAPEFTILQEGDKVIVHHNIARTRHSTTGKLIKSDFHIKEDLYFVPLTEVFMYKRGDQDWKAIAPYCFIQPIEKHIPKIGSIYIPDNAQESLTHNGTEKNIGKAFYINDQLEEQGVNEGDTVVFSNHSEYEFKIKGEIYYKMSSNDIVAVVE